MLMRYKNRDDLALDIELRELAAETDAASDRAFRRTSELAASGQWQSARIIVPWSTCTWGDEMRLPVFLRSYYVERVRAALQGAADEIAAAERAAV